MNRAGTTSSRPTVRAVVAVVVAVAACLAAGLIRAPAPSIPEATVRPVAAAVLACPRPAAGKVTSTQVGVVTALPDASTGSSPPVESEQVSSGRAALTPLRGASVPLFSLDAPGMVASAPAPVSQRKVVPWIARAEGDIAVNLGAGQVTAVKDGRGRGLLATACVAPSSDAWFVGGGGSIGRRTTIWLTNTDSSAAVVDVKIFGPAGPVEAKGGVGVEVAPHSQRALRLDVMAPGTARVALHVITRAGRVAASVTDVNSVGLIARGADFVPQSAPPARRVVVPGLVGGPPIKQILQVAAPGTSDAIVNVQIVAGDGTFAPDKAALLEITAGSVAAVDVSRFLKTTEAAAVLLTSDVPIVAGVRTIAPLADGRDELAYSAGVRPLNQPASFAPFRVDANRHAVLALTASKERALVFVTVLAPDDGQPSTREVSVAAGTTARFIVPETVGGSGLVVQAADGSGPVEAALLLSWSGEGGAFRSTVPLASGVASVTVPAVVPNPATGVRGR